MIINSMKCLLSALNSAFLSNLPLKSFRLYGKSHMYESSLFHPSPTVDIRARITFQIPQLELLDTTADSRGAG